MPDLFGDLLTDLAAAPCGSRELDERIALALGWKSLHEGKWLTPDAGRVHQGGWDIPPAYTQSLEAALTLVPAFTGDLLCSWRVGNTASGGGFAIVGTGRGEFDAGTPALALVIAALKARGGAR